ncbi:DNA-directed RNA polymerase III subunit rpc4 [Hypsizygus marmoreus]|uniref:DNA-directed RNA polymerase III subunit rpc4 n=1 Tax=Hypsizygus marmoreus TaxID=39966 RepID=A0A369JKK4_HYPMA|nr:DNA-directed RNA polymerase III subunit rpc4 [Hypsizygus marmoreus]
MADAPSGSGSGLPPTKAIGSLAKKQSDVTRQGTQKLKFVPTLPTRRKKDEVKPEPTPQALPSASTPERGRGRGRGRGEGRGRGRGRGAPRPELEMTASGPFAMGPALAGNNARRAVPRSNFAPIPIPGAGTALGSSLVRGAAPSLKREGDLKGKGVVAKVQEDEEVYSDPDEGVEIVDMEDVRQMDWMAPESLRKEKRQKKAKKEEATEAIASEQINRANALDLSESEEEEELEDIIEHFAARSDIEPDSTLREEKLYFFQFPSPFPTFISTTTETGDDTGAGEAIPAKDIKPEPGTSKVVSPTKVQIPEPKVDGVIGRLEIYRSGAVKMRLANGILLDVNAATQPSFLQQAVYLDKKEGRLSVLGEVNKRFSVSPDIETLLTAMEDADKAPATVLDGEELIQMDTT